MAGFDNSPNPWASSYDTYKDCSQGLCSMYCPQWCYNLIFPPPPPFSDSDDAESAGDGADFSPLIIAVIGILASAFILLSYYTIIAKYCRRRRRRSGDTETVERDSVGENDAIAGNPPPAATAGLEEGMIKAIRVYKYQKNDGFVDGIDCAVCLSEFEENEGLRLMPKCNHAFHVSCIDTWLKSHSSCPLCRADITAAADGEVVVVVSAATATPLPSVVIVVDEEEEEEEEGLVAEEDDSKNIGAIDRLLIADILREDEDEDDGMRLRLRLGIGTSSKRGFDDHDHDDEIDFNDR